MKIFMLVIVGLALVAGGATWGRSENQVAAAGFISHIDVRCDSGECATAVKDGRSFDVVMLVTLTNGGDMEVIGHMPYGFPRLGDCWPAAKPAERTICNARLAATSGAVYDYWTK